MASVTLKVTYKKETRRVPVNPSTWSVAEDTLRAVFDSLPERFGLTYYDDENDLITVSSDPELLEAFRLLDPNKVSSYKFNLVELKDLKHPEMTEEEREKKLEEKLKKVQERRQRKEEKAKAIQAKKDEREKQREQKEKQREEKKLLKQKEREQKLKEKEEKEKEKKEKKVTFSEFLQEIKTNQKELMKVTPLPPKVIPDDPIVAQWKASVPEPDDDDELEEETIDISGETECDLDDFIEINEATAKSAPIPIPSIPEAKIEVPIEIPKAVEKKETKETDLLELQLSQLAEMGFVDRERNVELLLLNNMEMTEVVKVLLGM